MEKPKPSSNLQVALGSLLAIIVAQTIVLSITFSEMVAQLPGPRLGVPPESVPFTGSVVVLAFLFLPLLWWRNKAGYVGAIGVAILTLVGIGFGFIGILAGSLAVGALSGLIVGIVISVVLIVSSAAAWRDKG